MEAHYGVGITNRYALFYGDEDPVEKLEAKKKAKEEKKKKSQAEKENKGVKSNGAAKEKSPKTNGIKETQNLKPAVESKPKEEALPKAKKPEKVKFEEERKPQAESTKIIDSEKTFVVRKESNQFEDKEKRFNGDARGYRGDREPREPKEPREEGDNKFGGRFGASRPPRGRGGGRGGRGGSDFRGKREFDRQSGSDRGGIKPVTKKNGGGSHNWGTDQDEIDEQTNNNADLNNSSDWGEQPKEAEPANADENAEKKDSPVANEEQPAEEQVKEITLDEWKATRGTKLVKPQYNLRKAGEGEDTSQWRNMYQLKKKKEEGGVEHTEEEKEKIEAQAKALKKKEIVDTNFHFADQPMRGGRGNRRGGSRGRGGDRDRFRERGLRDRRDFNRGPRNTPKVDVNNEHDFPSLG